MHKPSKVDATRSRIWRLAFSHEIPMKAFTLQRWIPLLVLSAFFHAGTAAADIYKCRTPDGRIEIANQPCASGSNTLQSRPDEPVSEANRLRAEREAERQRAIVEKSEAAQRASESSDRERAAEQRQAVASNNSSPHQTADECLRDLDRQALEASQRSQLEAACRNNPHNPPAYTPVYVPVPVPVPVYGGNGNPVDACIQDVMRLSLAPVEQRHRISQCQGNTSHIQPAPQTPAPTTIICPKNNPNCLYPQSKR